jgi:hypothetical protein
MLTPKICTEMFKKLIKTKPQQFTTDRGNEELIYKLGDYQLFIEIGQDFQVDYQVKMIVTCDLNRISVE